LLLWVAGGGDACGGAGGCVGNACFPHDDDSWTTGGGGRVTVFGFFFHRFSGNGGAFPVRAVGGFCSSSCSLMETSSMMSLSERRMRG